MVKKTGSAGKEGEVVITFSIQHDSDLHSFASQDYGRLSPDIPQAFVCFDIYDLF